MNVIMIGHKGAGKTTYIAVMYSILNRGIKGFSISATTNELHRKLMLLNKQIMQGGYPSSTDMHSTYKFELKYNEETILPFTWYDYRGSALFKISETSPEILELDEKIRNAHALIVFFDGEKIMRNDYSVQKEYRRTEFFIQRAISNRENDSYFPISLVITKADIPGINLDDSPMLRNIQSMCESISKNDKISGLLTSTIINHEQIINVHFPFLNSVIFGLKQERDSIEYEMNKHISKGGSYQNKANIFNDIWSAVVEEYSYRELANREYNRARRKAKVYDDLLLHANKIIEILQKGIDNQEILII